MRRLALTALTIVLIALAVVALSCTGSASETQLERARAERKKSEAELARLREVEASLRELQRTGRERARQESASVTVTPAETGAARQTRPPSGQGQRLEGPTPSVGYENTTAAIYLPLLRRSGDWEYSAIYVYVTSSEPRGTAVLSAAIRRKAGGGWTTVWYTGGPNFDDVGLRPPFSLEELARWLKKKYPDAPAGLFE